MMGRTTVQSQLTRRQFSAGHSQAEAVAEYEKWRKYTFAVAFPLMAGLTVYNVVVHFMHGHHDHDDAPPASYMKIRNRPYPWSCSDCSFFEMDCWAKCKAARK